MRSNSMRALRAGLLCLIACTSFAKDPGSLRDTYLFTHVAKGCEDVDLHGWNHPVRQVLAKYKAELERVQLCNGRKFPIFFVNLPYDPQGQTKSYYGPLYADMKKANGGWPYAFVVDNNNTVITMKYSSGGYSDPDFELFWP